MAASSWTRAPDLGDTARQTWLLANGDTITSPYLEQSPAGARVRIEGSTGSHGRSRASSLIYDWCYNEASSRGTHLWFVKRADPVADLLAHFSIDRKAEPDLAANSNITLYWAFKKDDIAVVLFTRLTTSTYYRREELYTVEHGIIHFAPANRVALGGQSLGGGVRDATRTGLRPAVKALATNIGQLNSRDTFQYSGDQKKFDLELVETNYTGPVVQKISELVNLAPAVQKVGKALDDLRGALRLAGIVMGTPSETSLYKFLCNQQDDVVATLRPTEVEDDSLHAVHFSLPNGMISVTCGHTRQVRTEVAQAWESARFIASLKGEEEQFLAFARQQVQEHGQDKLRRVLLDHIIAPEALTPGRTKND